MILSIPYSVYPQASESEVKAAYLERFTRFVEWPTDGKNKTSFEITIIGKNTFGTSLDNLFFNVKINSLSVALKYTDNYKNIEESDIIFICNSEKKNLSQIIKVVKTKPILIISDSEGFAQKGTHINLYVDDKYLRYEINPEAIKISGLKVSSLLMSSAKIVSSNE